MPSSGRLRGVHPGEVLSGASILMKRFVFISILLLALVSPVAWGQEPGQGQPVQTAADKKDIFVVVKDDEGGEVKGYLRLNSEEVTVRTREGQEKSIPVKYIKSITLEKLKREVPGDEAKRDPAYSVHVENSQEIYTLQKKYTFSLNTDVGLVTKTIDPDRVSLFTKDSGVAPKPDDGRPFVQDKSVVFSLEFKF